MKPYMKFGLLITVVVGTLAWVGASGVSQSATYYKTPAELQAMGNSALSTRLRVGGDVEAGSIQRLGKEVTFRLVFEKKTVTVRYNGTEPLPDTFRDGAQALADGRMQADGTFVASRIQAKCASKYEGKPGPGMKPGHAETTNTKRQS